MVSLADLAERVQVFPDTELKRQEVTSAYAVWLSGQEVRSEATDLAKISLTSSEYATIDTCDDTYSMPSDFIRRKSATEGRIPNGFSPAQWALIQMLEDTFRSLVAFDIERNELARRQRRAEIFLGCGILPAHPDGHSAWSLGRPPGEIPHPHDVRHPDMLKPAVSYAVAFCANPLRNPSLEFAEGKHTRSTQPDAIVAPSRKVFSFRQPPHGVVSRFIKAPSITRTVHARYAEPTFPQITLSTSIQIN